MLTSYVRQGAVSTQLVPLFVTRLRSFSKSSSLPLLSHSQIVLLGSRVTLSQLKRKKRRTWRVPWVPGGNVCLEHFCCRFWESKFNDNSSRARCVVCQLERVTRAALPCRYLLTFPTWFQPSPSNDDPTATLQWVILSAGMLSPVAHASIGSNLSVPCAGDGFSPSITILQWNFLHIFSILKTFCVFQGLYQFILLVGSRAPTYTWHSTTSFSRKVLATFAQTKITL